MTRETKLGIAVACAFLVLVGVVVVHKMSDHPPAREPGKKEPPAAASSAAANKPEETPPGPADAGMPPAAPTPGVVPARYEEKTGPATGAAIPQPTPSEGGSSGGFASEGTATPKETPLGLGARPALTPAPAAIEQRDPIPTTGAVSIGATGALPATGTPAPVLPPAAPT